MPPSRYSGDNGRLEAHAPVEVPSRDMRKKIIDFPKPETTPRKVHTASHCSRVLLHVGAQRFALDISCTATRLPRAMAPSPVIETKFLHLRQPAALGDRIDGWRVCWLGGWDKGKVFYMVMVERRRHTLKDEESI